MNGLRVLNSVQDKSVNFVEEQLVGFLESRYVRKCDDYFIAYLSSQTGCNRGCKFCHLTTTGQTTFEDSTHNDFIGQALNVFKHYRREKPARYMHYNFMARGEPLANQVMLESGEELLVKLGQLARAEGLPAKFNISTIMPRTLTRSLVEVFGYMSPTIYYSLYSMDEEWRKKWLPGAMPAMDALKLLKDYQGFSKKIVKIHHAVIADENFDQAHEIGDAVNSLDLICEFNLVRYNPAGTEQGREVPENKLAQYMSIIQEHLGPGKVQMIPRVGFDVNASCGMFVE